MDTFLECPSQAMDIYKSRITSGPSYLKQLNRIISGSIQFNVCMNISVFRRYLGWRECRGVWGREFTEPIARNLIHTRRQEDLPKLTLEVFIFTRGGHVGTRGGGCRQVLDLPKLALDVGSPITLGSGHY